jgi:hypothetical protein
MKAEHLLAWLLVADLEATGDDGLRTVLELVLEHAPDEPSELLDRLFDEVEDQLDATALNHELILAWPERYGALLDENFRPLEVAEQVLESRTESLSRVQVESPALARLQACLDKLRGAEDRETTALAWEELEALEAQMTRAHAEHAAVPFAAEAVSAESVAGQRFLEEGFECWFEAFDLAKVGRAEEALALANEGNRLFRAVADWSDEIIRAEKSTGL